MIKGAQDCEITTIAYHNEVMDKPIGNIIQDSKAGSHTGAPGLWILFQSCLQLFKDLIAKLLQASNISISVKRYFDPITRHMDNSLIRLEIWGFDTGMDDKDLKHASMNASSETERSVTSILEDAISQLKVIEGRVEHMHDIASAMLKAPNENLSAHQDLLSRFDADVNLVTSRKRNHQLDEVSKEVENSCHRIASTVHDLIDRTEAVRMYLATQYQCGPLAGLRDEMRTTRNQGPRTMDSSREEGPWTRKTLLTLGSYHSCYDDKTRLDLLDQMEAVSKITLLC